ncbi:uncharacterized protein LOC133933229 isoform X1 [Platichthys flesus]|uniref:uncharacterized protein LOC133933229 isoform X1 n=2 Tax=Platichthys flesus TaxID=8260 RepID=UPI002DBF0F90|nr:uncharacterized protein LOC133933229 isoform X1 [Platichthys flesus]
MKGNKGDEEKKTCCPFTLAQDIDLLCWGSGELGQTGCGRPGEIAPEEAQLREFTSDRLGTVKMLACGSSHSIVVTVDNRIFAWGNGTSGQLGDGEREVKDHPVEVKLQQELEVTGSGTGVNVVDIAGVACGSRHSFIWTQSGQAYSFGNNFYAQLGYDFQKADFKEHQLAPRLFQSLPSSLKVSQVACGERHTLFALEDGSVAACGQNDYGQIGSGPNENVVIPRFVERVGRVSKVTCGANHNLALTGDGRLFQWGCGPACGNMKKNILSPEEVTLPSSPVRAIAAGCRHSILLTDGGNVFSWGMGQEGQLGLGEDRIHVSAPHLLNYSHLAGVTGVRAGDSSSAAVTAGGELLLWGQIPGVSLVTDHPGLKRLWTPQPVEMEGRKVRDVACGTWHMMALATRSGEGNRGCDHPQREALFGDVDRNPPPTKHAEKENTAQDFKHRIQDLRRPEGPEEEEGEEKDEERRKKKNQDEGNGAIPDSAFAGARSAPGIDRTGNGRSSIKSDQGQREREGCTTEGPLELRKDPRRSRASRETVFTTLHLLPKTAGDQCRPIASSLPRLLTGHQAHSSGLAEAQKKRSTHLTELLQKSGSDSSILQSPDLRLKPRPPGRCSGPGAQRVASCHHSRTRLNTGPESPINNPSPRLTPGRQIQTSPSFHQRPRAKASLSPTPSSEASRYCPTPRRAVSSPGASWKKL